MNSYREQENVELKHESIREMWEEAAWENDSDDKIPEKNIRKCTWLKINNRFLGLHRIMFSMPIVVNDDYEYYTIFVELIGISVYKLLEFSGK